MIPYWNLIGAIATVQRHPEVFATVSPWLIGLTRQGQIASLDPEMPWTERLFGPSPAGSSLASRSRALGLPLMPTIANYHDHAWHPDVVQAILHDPAATARHVDEIVAHAVAQRWDGVTIDYEELHGRDRDAFTEFVRALAARLHDRGKKLAVDVFAKHHDAGYDERNLAQDYAALGAAADEIRLMAYDFHWETSNPGPIAPIEWVRSVVEYAVSVVPRDKVTLGIPLYGYDWSAGGAQPISWARASWLASEFGTGINRDQDSGAPWLTYVADGTEHTVWFEDAESVRAKVDIAQDYGIRGVFLWMYGPADPGVWSLLSSRVESARS